jgi:hypothetical protein
MAHLPERHKCATVVLIRPIFFASSMENDDGLPTSGAREQGFAILRRDQIGDIVAVAAKQFGQKQWDTCASLIRQLLSV